MNRIGIDFSVQKNTGGAYQYCLAFLEVLKYDHENEFVIFNYSPDLPDEYNKYFKVINFEHPPNTAGREKVFFRFFVSGIFLGCLYVKLFKIADLLMQYKFKDRIDAIEKSGVNLIIFPSGAQYSPFLKIPYVTTIYDLEHRKHPEFPEVSKKGQRKLREYYYKRICKTAKMILVDSEVGKKDVIDFYHVTPEKITVLPYLPPNYLENNINSIDAKEILKSFNLPDKFIFYPAQFWSHKNHLNLLKAIIILRDKARLVVPLVLCGSKKEEWGEFNKVQQYIKKNNLSDQVFYLGYVSNNEMSALYRLAAALVMPTFLGPTNIPVLEAWKMGCVVLYSDIDGCRQQLGDAGILINPYSPDDIAAKIKHIWNDNKELGNNLIIKGRKRLSLWSYQDFSLCVHKIIKKFS